MAARLPTGGVVRDVGTSYAGFVANAIFGFVTLRLMAQHLGLDSFGLASIANMFMAIVASLGDPGISTAYVRLASRPELTRSDLDELSVAALRLKLLVTGVICGVVYLLIPGVAGAFIHRPELTLLLRWCLIGAAFLSIANFAAALFQVRRTFRDNALAVGTASAARMVAVMALCGSGHLTLVTAVAAMILMNVVQCGVCLVFLYRMLIDLPWRCPAWNRFFDLLHYAKYLMVWILVGTIWPRADNFLLAHYVSDDRVLGLYAAAGQLCLILPSLACSINMVLLPQISSLKGRHSLHQALRQYRLGAMALLFLLLPVALLGGPLVGLVFGSRYRLAAPVFQVLFLAAAADVTLNPLSNFWHALNRPAMLSALNVARLMILALVCAAAIPSLGMMGAALAVMASTILPLGVQGTAIWWVVERHPTLPAAMPECALPQS